MGKNSNVHKRKTFHDADLEREREEEARKVDKKKKMQAKLLHKALAAPAASAPMDLERTTALKGKKGPPRAKALCQAPRAKGPLQGVKKKKSKESKIHKRQLIRATKARVRTTH